MGNFSLGLGSALAPEGGLLTPSGQNDSFPKDFLKQEFSNILVHKNIQVYKNI